MHPTIYILARADPTRTYHVVVGIKDDIAEMHVGYCRLINEGDHKELDAGSDVYPMPRTARAPQDRSTGPMAYTSSGGHAPCTNAGEGTQPYDWINTNTPVLDRCPLPR